jgi:predicted PurR-regulated permease PerM
MVIPAVFMIQHLAQESYTLFNFTKEKISGGIFSQCRFEICTKIEQIVLSPAVSFQIQSTTESFTSKVFELGSKFLLSIPRLFINLFVMFFTMFYFLRNGDSFLRKINDYLKMQKKEYAHILSRLKEIIHGVIYGYVMIACIQGILGALGFYLFGVHSPLFWGVVMALLALIPVLGTGFVWIPAAVVLVLEGLAQGSNMVVLKGVGLFLYGLLIVSTVDNFLRPHLIGEKARVHPILILLGVMGGLLYFGPLGVIIGPLLLSMTQVIVEVYLNRK